ncbi:hypothetical protein HPCPY3281_0629 [Helicobacter pylori CPY3281]|nr:hypothetical protein HPCPY3281_1717 [Helicobacter pylori CPY3281]EJB19829.1 hypothetical protein HPCPY3281_0629 [Helicobacter pylori CPY3281]
MIKFLKSACNQLFNAPYLFSMALFLLVGVLSAKNRPFIFE